MVRQFLVYDALDTCPYLPDRLARFPLRLSERKLRREELDVALAEGDRRQGVFLYRPSCPECKACEAIRLSVDDFTLTPSLRRVLARGDAKRTLRVGPAVADEERAELYARHKWGRGLAGPDEAPEVLGAIEKLLPVASQVTYAMFRQELAAAIDAEIGQQLADVGLRAGARRD